MTGWINQLRFAASRPGPLRAEREGPPKGDTMNPPQFEESRPVVLTDEELAREADHVIALCHSLGFRFAPRIMKEIRDGARKAKDD